jgi:hypothetical protein
MRRGARIGIVLLLTGLLAGCASEPSNLASCNAQGKAVVCDLLVPTLAQAYSIEIPIVGVTEKIASRAISLSVATQDDSVRVEFTNADGIRVVAQAAPNTPLQLDNTIRISESTAEIAFIPVSAAAHQVKVNIKIGG